MIDVQNNQCLPFCQRMFCHVMIDTSPQTVFASCHPFCLAVLTLDDALMSSCKGH